METKFPVNIMDYSDFRHYLADAFLFHKENKPFFSHRYISQKVKASSAGWFSNIIKGRINLTRTYFIKLASLFQLNVQETEYFELLVELSQACTNEERMTILGKMTAIKGLRATLVKKDQLLFYKTWYISAIRELLFFYDFKGNYDELSQLLNPPITKRAAQEALDILYSLRFIYKDVHGIPRPCDSVIEKDCSGGIDQWVHIMKTKIGLGFEAIEKFDSATRDISEVYFPLSKAGFAEAQREIRALRKKLLLLSMRDRAQERVYQCNIQLFPLTNCLKPEKTGNRNEL